MFVVGKRVSFSIVVALILGWGIFGLLFLQAGQTLLQAQADELDRPIPLPPGVRLSLQVDKRVYRSGDTVLIALRNDSRRPIWLAEHADGCRGPWWQVEMLGSDGETWSAVSLTADTCPTASYGLVSFPRHLIKSDAWVTLVPSRAVGPVVVPAPAGTYRIVAPYVKGAAATAARWTSTPLAKTVTPTFTLQ